MLTQKPAHAMGELRQSWAAALAGQQMRVILTDPDDPRVREAADELAASSEVVPVLADQRWLEAAAVDPAVQQVLAERLVRLPAGDQLRAARDPLYICTAAVRAGLADACVAGSTCPTAAVVRAGLRVLGLEPGVRTASSSFLMGLPDGRVVAYADCAIIPEPNASQLADIAISTSQTLTRLTGQTPAVAMLSFSTKGSADHPLVERVRAGTELVRLRVPDLPVDGELQFDAAFVEAVATRKAAGSPVAGRANAFIFPNLDAGNIAYKITERLAGAAAIGPLLQGFQAPLNDLSRGCSAADIATVAVVSAVQAVLAPTPAAAGSG